MDEQQFLKEFIAILKSHTEKTERIEINGEWVDEPVGEFIPTPHDKPVMVNGRVIK